MVFPEQQFVSMKRDYSPEDVILLKRIIILRKLGFSIVEVKAILSGKVSLTTAAEAQKKKLQEQVKDLNGAILICQEMEAENEDIQSFDESYYWNEIQEKEKALNDTVYKVKKNSLDYASRNAKEVSELQEIINEQKKLQKIRIIL